MISLASFRPLRLFAALLAEAILLSSLRFFDDWTLESMPVKFVATAIGCGIAYLVAVTNFPVVASRRGRLIIFWSVTIGLRLLAIPLEPGDDLWRYEWEGKIQQTGFNPYVFPPDAPELEPLRDTFPAWLRINHRDFSAIYPPGAELTFRATSALSENPLLYKFLFGAADIGVVALLLRLVGRDRSYTDAAWYAWNPLVIYSFAGAAHFDSLMLLPMVAGLLLLTRFEVATTASRKWLLATGLAVAFGLAISMKLVPILLLPLCVAALGLRAITLVISLAIPAAMSLIYGFPKVDILSSLGRFAHVTRLNDLFWWIVEDTVWLNPRQKNYHYNVILIVTVIAVSLLFYRNWRRGMLWVFGITLILSPVLHPWYCTWILPLAAWRRSDAWQILSVTLFAYYLFWNERLFALPWHAEPWMRAIIISPPLAAAVLMAWSKRRVSNSQLA